MEEFYIKATYYCAMSEHCIKKVREKLIQWGTPNECIDSIIEKLLEADYISEERYAESYVKDKFRFNKWGKVKIQAQLKANNIPARIINKALENIVDEDYEKILDEVLDKKRKSIKNGTDYEIRAKLLRHALSKGFEYDLIASKLNI